MQVAFLANSFHLTKTKSTDFLIDLLCQWFGGVTVIPHKDAWARLPGRKWDLLVVFQKMWDPAELEAFGAARTVLVPMYDDCPKSRAEWDAYRGFRILSFSSTLGNDLSSWGHDVLTVQYWQEIPPQAVTDFAGLRGFFWPRTTGLTWKLVRVLTSELNWQQFHLHVTNAEGAVEVPTEDDRARWHIRQTSWFENAADAKSAVASANVYFAPRRFEGIGQAVLEALALGQCVVAPNAATMNEYIVDGVTGVLFDPETPRPLDLRRAAELGHQARQAAIAGRARWEASWSTIRDFLAAPAWVRPKRFRLWIVLKGRGIAFLRTLFRSIKRIIRGAL